MTANSPPTRSRPPEPAPAAEDLTGTPLDPVSRLGGALLSGVAEGQLELLQFLGSRLAKNANALNRFWACKTPAEILQLQLQLGADVVSDCLSEAQRVLGVLEKAASENLALVP